MALTPGTRLGSYEVTAPLGVGGMGEVYRATDTKLKREVAVKVLPESLAADPERLARFQSEAEVLASLNHPNIAAIYGVEEGPGEAGHSVRALVLELVEGPTLADRIAQGAIPIEDALPIARQMAEALEAAHERGIIHRDLKPANVKVRPDGVVKVLDFGLAKLVEGPAQAGHHAQDLTASPTITSPAVMTGVGTILGTAAYMAPEQAKGRPSDKRSDIWAFGCVLFEMLTGRRAFPGDDMSEVFASILARELDWSALPAAVPPSLHRLLRRCLQKDRTRRLADVADARLEIDEALATPARVGVEAAVPAPATRTWRVILPWVAGLLISVATGTIAWNLRPASPAPQSVRFQIPPPGTSVAQMFTLSADGRSLAFVANTGGPNQLWVRAMDTLEARALPGTDDARYPFWSPDGASLGFFAQGKLRKIAVAGGPAQTLCDVADGRGGTWNRDGVIVFSIGPTSPLLRVSAAGGVPAPATTLVEGDANAGHRFPVFLPDGVHFLYNAGSDKPEASGLYLGSLDGSAATRLLPDVTNALYVPAAAPSGSGYLVFRREETLMAQPFDPQALTLTGEMFPVAEQVADGGNAGFGAFSVSENGTLVYRTGGPESNRELVWMDRTGTRLRVVTKPGAMAFSPAISPDERTAAVQIQATGLTADIWLQDLERDVISRFTFRPSIHNSPIWSPDGSRVAFLLRTPSTRSYDIYQKPASGSGQEELLLHAGVNGRPNDWSPDGQWIVYQQTGQTTANDLWLLPLEGRKPIPYLQTPFNEQNARFWPGPTSAPPWMAYDSNESGQSQIYVQAIPASGAKFQISTSGGTLPTWRRDGKELYYLSTDQKLMAVPIALGTSVTPGTPQPLFAADFTGYTPSADGQRFLVNVPAGGQAAAVSPITVILNWTAGLTR